MLSRASVQHLSDTDHRAANIVLSEAICRGREDRNLLGTGMRCCFKTLKIRNENLIQHDIAANTYVMSCSLALQVLFCAGRTQCGFNDGCLTW